ncbi:hypothetical protein [Actinomadura rubrisoli]|uniref:Uncharacterized protein n=1 Tax=Actinomadura rubrisoli TaxID=2530368 RepID=A0A4V2YZM0_9ACTN|nr:hypothetical protein [Actinomadura rubrisoli]TDD97687.1 hypothetical protein E1298_01230 [Actinomadura rubrisoli]
MNALRRLWHRLSGEHIWQFQPAETSGSGRRYGPWFFCSACGSTVKAINEPPSSHPESMTVELPDEDEELLAELEDATWPPRRGQDAVDTAEACAQYYPKEAE